MAGNHEPWNCSFVSSQITCMKFLFMISYHCIIIFFYKIFTIESEAETTLHPTTKGGLIKG